MSSSKQFIDELRRRRSVYSLNARLPITNRDVAAVITAAAREAPSAFNVQSARLYILYGEEHQKLWRLVLERIKAVVPPDAYEQSAVKVRTRFAAGAGTVLFFEDQDAMDELARKYPLYKSNFPTFSEHNNAMAQLAVWTALAQENIGASLQHYNELIAADMHEAFGVPRSYRLVAQMPFGGIAHAAEPKEYMEDSKRVVVRGLSKL